VLILLGITTKVGYIAVNSTPLIVRVITLGSEAKAFTIGDNSITYLPFLIP
jgi:hypothetical protein